MTRELFIEVINLQFELNMAKFLAKWAYESTLTFRVLKCSYDDTSATQLDTSGIVQRAWVFSFDTVKVYYIAATNPREDDFGYGVLLPTEQKLKNHSYPNKILTAPRKVYFYCMN